jgi:RNA polymerase sigma-54 factor
MLEQKLQQKLLQKLSPQQIQLIKMLEIPIMELEQRIKKELEENPALEEGEDEDELITSPETDDIINEDSESDEISGEDTEDVETKSKEDDFSYEDYISEEDSDETPYYNLNVNNHSPDDEAKEFIFPEQDSFIENLVQQIGFLELTDKQKALAEYIVGNLDEKGFLQRDIESIADDLAFTYNVETSPKEIEEVLLKIQTLEPSGVGARTIQECFQIQLLRKTKSESIKNAISIINECFEELMKKHYPQIQRKLNLTSEELKDAINEIQHLNVNPGYTYADHYEIAKNQLIPDFIVELDDNHLNVYLNSKYAPDLHVSKSFQEMLHSLENKSKSPAKEIKTRSKEAVQFAKQKVESAKWFIDAIQQRQNTLLTTIQAIVALQKSFFIEGERSLLRPMILKDVADLTGFDISTISRVVSNKYVLTPHGVYSLKSFFSESLTTDDDEIISTYKVKERIQEIVSKEDKNNPITDEELADILKKEGLSVARRTVAKYREQLKIPVARLRKEL